MNTSQPSIDLGRYSWRDWPLIEFHAFTRKNHEIALCNWTFCTVIKEDQFNGILAIGKLIRVGAGKPFTDSGNRTKT